MIKEIDDPEIEKVLEDYEESQFNGEDMLTELEVFIVKCKEKRQIELNERKQRMEMEQKEKTNERKMTETQGISSISIPRYIGSKDAQLICFCDASKRHMPQPFT